MCVRGAGGGGCRRNQSMRKKRRNAACVHKLPLQVVFCFKACQTLYSQGFGKNESLQSTASFFPQHMLKVSFSLGRDRACRHCWMSSFWQPSEKRLLSFTHVLKKDPLDNTCNIILHYYMVPPATTYHQHLPPPPPPTYFLLPPTTTYHK